VRSVFRKTIRQNNDLERQTRFYRSTRRSRRKWKKLGGEADIQDRDTAPVVLNSILKRWPWLRHIFADGPYAGPKL
jgi:hypothetical protein